MEVKIGVVYTPKELSLEMEGEPETVVGSIEEALSQKSPMVWLTDCRGRRVGIPSDKLAYVEIERDGTSKQVGFGKV
ncbi:MAG: DUF3107 domain-containing protein [Acidimicrobiia bacterium]|nr:DUF3107 domain-containing protein [Acidimicrobiia bacterium]